MVSTVILKVSQFLPRFWRYHSFYRDFEGWFDLYDSPFIHEILIGSSCFLLWLPLMLLSAISVVVKRRSMALRAIWRGSEYFSATSFRSFMVSSGMLLCAMFMKRTVRSLAIEDSPRSSVCGGWGWIGSCMHVLTASVCGGLGWARICVGVAWNIGEAALPSCTVSCSWSMSIVVSMASRAASSSSSLQDTCKKRR